MRDMHAHHDALMEEFSAGTQAHAELERCMNWEECEIDPDFTCFAHIYAAARILAPEHWTILDMGCYQGVQAHMFSGYKAYIGVDVSVPLEWRFKQENAKHFLEEGCVWLASNEAARDLNTRTTLAILSYVPDEKLNRAVRMRFPNVISYYPNGENVAFLSHEKAARRT